MTQPTSLSSYLFEQRNQDHFLTATPEIPAAEVVTRMDAAGVSCALILDQQRLTGIFTDRDLVRAIAHGADLGSLPISALMIAPVISVVISDADDLDSLKHRFDDYKIKYLPILNNEGTVVNVITYDALNEAIQQHQSVLLEQEVNQRQQFIASLAESELRYQASENKLNDILKNANAAIISAHVFPDRSWQYDYLSPGCETIFGYTSEELMADQKLWWSRVLPEDIESLIVPSFDAIFAEQACQFEYRFLHKDGSQRWIAVSITSHREESTNSWSVTKVHTDVSDRKRIESEHSHAEKALSQSEELLHQIVNNIDDVFYIKTIGSGELLFLNQAYEQTYHFSVESIFQQPLSWLDKIHPDDRDYIQAKLQQQLRGEAFFDDEYRIVLPNGEVRWIWDRSFPIYNEKGEVYRYAGVNRDITARKQSEEALRQSEELLQLIANTINQLFFVTSVETGQYLYINQGYEKIWGRSCKSLYEEPDSWLEAVHPEDRDRVLDSLSRQMQGEFEQREYRIIRPDGEIRWINAFVFPVRDESGKPVQLVGLADDITDRKQMEDALQESEQFLRSIYETAEEGIFVVDVIDGDFRFHSLNSPHSRITGLTTKDILGKTPEEILPPADAASARRNYESCINTGSTITYVEFMPFLGQDLWWLTRLTPIRNEDSQIYRIVGVSTNITEFKRIESALRQSEKQFRTIFDSAGMGIAVSLPPTYNLSQANPTFCKMLGYSPEELANLKYEAITHPNDLEIEQPFIEKIFAGQLSEYTLEKRYVCKNGNVIWGNLTASIIRDESGQIEMAVALVEDITNRKLAEAQIQASLHEKEILLREIHHRVKNNLQIISSLLHLQANRVKDDQIRTALEDSWNRIDSMALVHENLYRSSNLAGIDLAAYIQALVNHLLEIYNICPNTIQLNLMINSAVMLNLEQAIPCGLILNELVSNALKHGFPKKRSGELLIQLTRAENQQVTLIVGNPVNSLPPDFDINNVRTMGLRLVISLVKQLEGTIEVIRGNPTLFKVNFYSL